MARPRIVVATLAYVTLISIVLLGSNWLSYRRFAMEGRATVATVVETTCGNHATFVYEFKANDRIYRARGGDGYGNHNCSALKSGDRVNIWYLPADPSQSVAGDPRERQNNEAMTIVVGVIWFGLFLGIFIWRELRPARYRASRSK